MDKSLYAPDGAPDMAGMDIPPDPVRTWKHRLKNTWNMVKGCACSGMATQGGIHALCIVFAGASGAGSSSLSRLASSALNSGGVIGLTASETLQYIAAPALSVPVSYGVDLWRKSQYSLSKAGIALAVSAATATGISYLWPHQHDVDMAVTWFDAQPKDTQDQIRKFASETNQTVNDVALGMCSSDPTIQMEMDRLKSPAYQRVYDYFAR